MKILTSKEWYEGLMLAESFSDKREYVWGFSAGMQYVIDKLAPKPHVTEVVKCGRITVEGMGSIPAMITMAKTCDHVRDKNISLKSRNGIVSADEQSYMCPKCSKWINGPSI